MKINEIILRIAFIWLLPYYACILYKDFKSKYSYWFCLQEAWLDWWYPDITEN